MAEPTTPRSKRTVARRVFAERAGWSRACGIVRRSQTASGMLPPHASPSGPFHENSALSIFRTGSKSILAN